MLSVLLDVFVPVLPSGVLLVAAASAGSGGRLPQLLALMCCAATASVAGDLLAYRLASRGGDRFDRLLARNRRLAVAQERLGEALTGAGGLLVVLARFAPAGRSVVSLTAGVTRRRVETFLPWSALAGATWATYGVSAGYFGARWLGASWHGTVVSVGALLAAGSVAAYVLRRQRTPRPRHPAPDPPMPRHTAGELERWHV